MVPQVRQRADFTHLPLISSTSTATANQVKWGVKQDVQQKDEQKVITNQPEAPHGAITSLCTELETLSSKLAVLGETCYGYFRHGETCYQVYGLNDHSPSNSASDSNLPAAPTLKSVIDSDRLRTFQRLSRYNVALTIASSFVQLLETPWLPSALTKDDILFMDGNSQGHSKQVGRWHQPQAKHKLYLQLPSDLNWESTTSNNNGNEDPDSHSPPTATTTSHRDHYSGINPFAKLAIILFELCLGQPIRDHPVRKEWEDKYPAPHEFTQDLYDMHTAQELLRELGQEAGAEAEWAVRWCFTMATQMGLQQYVGKTGETEKWQQQQQQQTEKWRAEMWVNVVEPLRNCVHWMEFGERTVVNMGSMAVNLDMGKGMSGAGGYGPISSGSMGVSYTHAQGVGPAPELRLGQMSFAYQQSPGLSMVDRTRGQTPLAGYN